MSDKPKTYEQPASGGSYERQKDGSLKRLPEGGEPEAAAETATKPDTRRA